MIKKITVIVPIYNVEKYLEKCILSIINQTMKDLEIILINDGSTDKSNLICEKYKNIDERIKYISRENKGCGYTRNEGIRLAKSKYIAFVDPDDYLEIDVYEKLYKKIEEKGSDLCICGYKMIRENKICFYSIDEELAEKSDIYLKSVMYISVWNKLYKTKIIKNNGIYFPENIKISEDVVFNFKYYLKLNKIAVVNENLYNYFVRDDSITKNYKNYLDAFKALDCISKLFKTQKKDRLLKKVINEIFLHILCRTNYAILEDLKAENKPYFKIFKNGNTKYEKKYKKDMLFSTKFKLFYRKVRLNFVFLRPLYRKIRNI